MVLRRLIYCMRGEWTFIPDGSGTVMPRPMSSSHFVGAISSVRHLLVPPLAGHPHRLVHVADGLANAVPNPRSIASTNRCKINKSNKTAHDSEGDIRKHEPFDCKSYSQTD